MADSKKRSGQIQLDVNPDTTPIFYTDNVNLTLNEDGVVLNVCQRIGNSNRYKVVARVGMSHTHAKKFVNKMGELLMKTGQFDTDVLTKHGVSSGQKH